jgi:ribosomal protein S27AE
MIYVDELKERARKYNREWKQQNREKVHAHDLLNRAVRVGAVKKPRNCQRCGRLGKRLNGHHKDYAKPLEVEWLCGACHLAEHGMQVS